MILRSSLARDDVPSVAVMHQIPTATHAGLPFMNPELVMSSSPRNWPYTAPGTPLFEPMALRSEVQPDISRLALPNM